MKRFAGFTLLAILGLFCILVVRAAMFGAPSVRIQEAPPLAIDPEQLAERLGALIRIPTISHQGGANLDEAAFTAFHDQLEASYPLTHATLTRESVSSWSLLYTWRGSEAALAPILLAAHIDVVPVEPGTESDWDHPAFSGAIAEGAIWGRGSLDDKVNLAAQMEAVERMIADGFTPRRTVYLAFGHDEELGGDSGAKMISSLLRKRGVSLALAIDEGGSVLRDMLPGFDAPLAIVGISEKGYASAELVVELTGGHSSAPPFEGAIGILARAIDRIEQNQLEPRLDGVMRSFFEEGIGPSTSFGPRLVFANLWLFGPILERALVSFPLTATMVRTTTAPTIFNAGTKDNVLPSRARAVVNFRLLPGDTTSSVLRHVVETVDDGRVRIALLEKQRDPSPISRTDTAGWNTLVRTINEVVPGSVVAPYLVPGGTDARHYSQLSDSVYRFAPFGFGPDAATMVHGTNEHIPVEEYASGVRFYRRLIQNAQQPAAATVEGR